MSSPYREQQRGGLCRLHATNAYLVHSGHNALSDASWNEWIKSFSDYMHDAGYSGDVCAASWDYFHASQETIVSYILEKIAGVFCLLIPYGFLKEMYFRHEVSSETFIFVFTATHIWACVFHDGKWWLVDSMKPLSVLPSLQTYILGLDHKKHGLLLPRSQKRNVMRDFLDWEWPEADVSSAVQFRMLRFIPPPCSISEQWVLERMDLYKKWRRDYEKSNNRTLDVPNLKLNEFCYFLNLYRNYICRSCSNACAKS